MLAKIIYIIGIIIAVWCVLDIFKKPWSLVKKLIVAVLVLITSWVGALLYYLLRDRI